MYLNGGMKTWLKKPDNGAKFLVFKWSAKSRDFTIWIRRDTHNVRYSDGYCSPNYLKTGWFQIWMFLFGFQLVFDKMAAICPDFKCFLILDLFKILTSFRPFKIRMSLDFRSQMNYFCSLRSTKINFCYFFWKQSCSPSFETYLKLVLFCIDKNHPH